MPCEKYAVLLARKPSRDPGLSGSQTTGRMAVIRPSTKGVMLLPDAAVGGLAATVIETFGFRNDDPAITIESSMIIDNRIFIDDFVSSHWSLNDACAAVGRHHR
jgi:hypothetical protein